MDCFMGDLFELLGYQMRGLDYWMRLHLLGE
jgi:hypothetical protein